LCHSQLAALCTHADLSNAIRVSSPGQLTGCLPTHFATLCHTLQFLKLPKPQQQQILTLVVLCLLEGLARCFIDMHREGVVHQDGKPTNMAVHVSTLPYWLMPMQTRVLARSQKVQVLGMPAMTPEIQSYPAVNRVDCVTSNSEPCMSAASQAHMPCLWEKIGS
jgi:hypothetical protein